jgi:hypothetical protein
MFIVVSLIVKVLAKAGAAVNIATIALPIKTRLLTKNPECVEPFWYKQEARHS